MPASEAPVLIHGAKPLTRRFPLNFILLIFFALRLNDKNFIVGQSCQEVRPVFMFAAVEDVANFKSEMVVLHPSSNMRASIEMESSGAFPSAIADTEIDMRFSRVDVGLARIPRSHVASRDDRLVGVNDQFVCFNVLLLNERGKVINHGRSVEPDQNPSPLVF
jgi:hypothetical protein